MRSRISVAVLMGLALATGLPAPATHAAPTDIARAPDLSLRLCSSRPPTMPAGAANANGRVVLTCVVRAVGDVNGDAMDDLVVEWVGTDEMVTGTQTQGSARQFDVLVAPYLNTSQSATASFLLTTEVVRSPLSLVDVDGDGIKDIVFTSSELMGAYEAQRVSVVLGRRAWRAGGKAEVVDLGRAAAGDLTFERRAELGGQAALFGPGTTVTPAFADVNGDRSADLVLGLDSAFMANLEQLGAVLPAGAGSSAVAVMFGGSQWEKATAFRDDVVWSDLGVCRLSLAGVADVTGDRVADIVARRCPGSGLPDELRVVAGGAGILASTELAPVTLARPRDLYDGTAEGGEGPNVPPPAPDPGRGYIPSGGGTEPTPFFPAPFFLEDVNGDAVRDIVLGFGANTHIWLGGPDVARKVARMQSDRVFVKAGYGHMSSTDGWRTADLDGDGRRDLLLTGTTGASAMLGSHCAANAGCVPGAAGRTSATGLTSMKFFKTSWADAEVLDLDTDAPDAEWNDAQLTPWAMGDFNGDGRTDLLLGLPMTMATRVGTNVTLSIALGPL